jgi:hypothetical protein
MACTFYHAPTGRWLTSLGKNAKAGDTPTLSIGHPLCGGEFTKFRLGEPVAHDARYDEPLFDLDEAEIEMPHGSFYPRAKLAEIRKTYARSFELDGVTYVMGGFSIYRRAA